MGCNCGKGKKPAPVKKEQSSGQTQQFRLITPDGSSTVYGSRLEAEAARVRSGRAGTVVSTRF